MPSYTVMVDDNFHYMDEDERWQHGIFATAEEAVAACRQLVERSLLEQFKPGMTAAQLYEQYAFFGEDPFVLALEGAERVDFSARDYARERAEALCAEGR
jgi:hypothetical protein